jgi:hypothetical protein
LGVGASVAAALFIVGFSVPSGQFQRILAPIELLRGVAAYLVAPILLHLAMIAIRRRQSAPRSRSGRALAWRPDRVARGLPFCLSRDGLQTRVIERWMSGDVGPD